MTALLIDDHDLAALLQSRAAIAHGFLAVERALRNMDGASPHCAAHAYLPMAGGERYSLLVDAQPALGTSIRSFPADGTPPAMDAVAWMLVDPQTGALLAIFTARQLSALRTAFPSVAGARLLASRNVEKVAIIGSGRQAMAHALLLDAAFPNLREINCHSADPERGAAIAAHLRAHSGATVIGHADRAAAISGADIVFLLGAPGQPQIAEGEACAGSLIVSLSADVPAVVASRATTFVPAFTRPADLSGAPAPAPFPAEDRIALCDWIDRPRSSSPTAADRDTVRIWELGGLFGWDTVVARWAYDAGRDADIGTRIGT